jgi:hypothetical protein
VAEESISVEKIGGIIPLFFYDVIGHILPGTTLILGCVWYFKGLDLSALSDPNKEFFWKNAGVVGTALFVLFFFGLAEILGMFLKPISFHLIQAPTRQWIDPLCKEKLRKFLGLADIHDLKVRFRMHFGSDMLESEEKKNRTEDKALNPASFLCAYYAMRIDPNLGLLSSRWDAEALSIQSLSVVILIFVLLPLLEYVTPYIPHFPQLPPPKTEHGFYWSLFCLTLFGFNYGAYIYLRQKRVFGRFALFLAVTAKDGRAEQKKQ